MNKYRDIYCNHKKNMAKTDKEIVQRPKTKNCLRNDQEDEGTKYFHYQSITQHIESQFTKSSRIADQCETSQHDFQSFQTSILKKVEQIQEESNRLLQEKEEYIYAVKIKLETYQQRLKQAEQMLVVKDKKISRLEYEIQILKNATQNHEYLIQTKQMQQILKENQKLKESLNFLIEQKNQNWQSPNHESSTSIQNKQIIQKMRQQIEDLSQIVEQLESEIKRCSKCITLTRQKQELSVAYNCLVKQHLQLTASQSKKEKQFIRSISNKIKQNQNILRQNLNLKQPQERRTYTTLKYQGLTDSITSPCRFLTDHF